MRAGRRPPVRESDRKIWAKAPFLGIGILADIGVKTRPLFLVSTALFSLILVLFLLSLVPFYPSIRLKPDAGGALAKPSFAEVPSARGTLRSWPFNEYTLAEKPAVRVTVRVGDLFFLSRNQGDGRRVSLRISSNNDLPSSLIVFDKRRTIEKTPLSQLTAESENTHEIAGWIENSSLHFSVDGNPIERAFPVGANGSWELGNGLKSSEILRIESGPSITTLSGGSPWLFKHLAWFPLSGLCFILLTALFGYLPVVGRGFVIMCWFLIAAMLWSQSLFLLIALPMLALIVLVRLSGSLIKTISILRKNGFGKPVYPVFVAVLSACVLIVGFASMTSASRVAGAKPSKDPIWSDPIKTGLPSDSIQAGSDVTRAVLFGASTAIGEGLQNPPESVFPHLLNKRFEGRVTVETWAKGAAALDELLKYEQLALETPAALAILYFTFNGAMYPQQGSLGEAIFRMNGMKMLRSFYAPSDWMKRVYQSDAVAFEQSVREFVKVARNRGAKVLLVTEVCADQILYRDQDHGIRFFHRAIEKVAKEETAEFLDLTGAFIDARDEVVFVDPVHFNRYGHEILADKIGDKIEDLLLPEVIEP
jgi:lysophospholipase L1-like esterase